MRPAPHPCRSKTLLGPWSKGVQDMPVEVRLAAHKNACHTVHGGSPVCRRRAKAAGVSPRHPRNQLSGGGYHLPLSGKGTEMLSNVSEIPQLISPRCGIQTQVCLLPNSSVLYLNKKGKKHLLAIHFVSCILGATETQSSGGDKSPNAIRYNIRRNGIECKFPPHPTKMSMSKALEFECSVDSISAPSWSQELFVE